MLSGGGFPRVSGGAGDRNRNILCFPFSATASMNLVQMLNSLSNHEALLSTIARWLGIRGRTESDSFVSGDCPGIGKLELSRERGRRSAGRDTPREQHYPPNAHYLPSRSGVGEWHCDYHLPRRRFSLSIDRKRRHVGREMAELHWSRGVRAEVSRDAHRRCRRKRSREDGRA